MILGHQLFFSRLFFVLYREGISKIYLLIAFIILSISILTIKTSISTAILLSLIIILLNYLYKKKNQGGL